MKKIAYIVLAVLALAAAGCSKDDGDSGIKSNTWSLTPEGFGAGSYQVRSTSLRVDGFQLFEAVSEENPTSDGNGIASTVKFFFKNVNPPPTGTYKVVAYEDLEHEDEVAVYCLVYGDPRLGGNNAAFFSHNETGKTISYIFKDGKASLKCSELPIYQTGFGPAKAYLSANIRQ